MAELSTEDVERRVRAKRFNEQLKLFATTLNAIGLTILGAAVLLPLFSGVLGLFGWIWILIPWRITFAGTGLLTAAEERGLIRWRSRSGSNGVCRLGRLCSA